MTRRILDGIGMALAAASVLLIAPLVIAIFIITGWGDRDV